MADPKLSIYAVSDATGELAISVVTSALRQFKKEGVSILRRAKTNTPERVLKVVREAADSQAFIIFTLVSPHLREVLIRAAMEGRVPVVDVMGPVVDQLSQYFHTTPSEEPGLRYAISSEYFRRNEAIEFTVKHDDGQGLETMPQADIVLIGISRTSKTPLSIYLAYRGFKTANVPLIRDVPFPRELRTVKSNKLVGLCVTPEKLSELRTARLSKLGVSMGDGYADIDSIREELAYSEKVFRELGNCPVIDVTTKAVEEVASEVLTVLGL